MCLRWPFFGTCFGCVAYVALNFTQACDACVTYVAFGWKPPDAKAVACGK